MKIKSETRYFFVDNIRFIQSKLHQFSTRSSELLHREFCRLIMRCKCECKRNEIMKKKETLKINY